MLKAIVTAAAVAVAVTSFTATDASARGAGAQLTKSQGQLKRKIDRADLLRAGRNVRQERIVQRSRPRG